MNGGVGEFVGVDCIPKIQAGQVLFQAKFGEQLPVIIIRPTWVVEIIAKIAIFTSADKNRFVYQKNGYG